jgi:hypothetical protein
MKPARASRSLPGRQPQVQSAGGLIVVGGPPFHGKAVLAARLADILPYACKLEAIDSLSALGEHWYPEGPALAPREAPLARLLEAAVDVWQRNRDSAAPAIIVCARAATPELRRLARESAAAAEMRFLHVEARSSDIRAMQQLSSLVLSKDDLLLRMERYEEACASYAPVGRDEARTLPALALHHVLGDVDAAVGAVLRRWSR